MTLVQIAQRAEDLDRAAGFYADLLGRAPTATSVSYTHLTLPTTERV